MFNIVIIGAGQLGSRHLQSLAKSDLDLNIEVVEPSLKAAEVAKSRFEEIEKGNQGIKINFFTGLEELSSNIDLAIVATNSDIRSKIIKNLLTLKLVKNLILEKVLFQKEEDYFEIEKLLSDKQVNAWVNHPRRMFPLYEKIKKSLEGSEFINYQVSGGGWGLACNGLHFLDHLSFISSASGCNISTSFLLSKIINSKREGFFEVIGNLTGKIGNHFFDLSCMEKFSPTIINISSEKINWIIDEANNRYSYAELATGWKWNHQEEKVVFFQSELTHVAVKSILLNKSSSLPTYKEAVGNHLPFISSLKDHIEKNTKQKLDYCPIT